MIRCAHCGCQNIKGAKECSNCKGKILPGGIIFQPATFTKRDKFFITLAGLLFLCVGLYVVGEYIYEFIFNVGDSDMFSIIFYLILGLFELFPCLICFGVAYFLYFCVKHGKNAEDVNKNMNNNKPL